MLLHFKRKSYQIEKETKLFIMGLDIVNIMGMMK